MLDLICCSTFGTLLSALSGGRILINKDQTVPLFLYLQPRLRRNHAPLHSEKEKTYEDAESTPVDRTQETAIVASDVEECQAADPFLVDWMIMTQIIYLVAELVNRVYDYLTV